MNTIYSVLVILALFSACTDNGICIKGDGKVNAYELEVSDFDEVAISGPIDLTLIQGEVQSVKVLAERQLMEVLEYDVRGGELMIGFHGKIRCFNSSEGVRVIATVPDLRKVSIDGDSQVDSEGRLHLEDFTVVCHGEGEIALEGSVERQFFIVNGKIEVENFNFLSHETVIEVNGKGDFEVSCSDKLDLDINGKAEVSYRGAPSITQDVNGSLDLHDAN